MNNSISASEIKARLTEQRLYFQTGKTRDLRHRIAALKKFKSLLYHYEQELLDAVYTDFKKSRFEAYATELGVLHNEINHTLRNVRRWSNRRWVPSNLANIPSSNYVYAEPLGNCLIIGSWNYPFLMSLSPVIPALAAGNTVILKPSELPLQTSAVMRKMINEHFDPGHFHVIEGGQEEASTLIHLKFDKIFFTGSNAVGRIVYKAAAENLVPVTLELGGKSPAIVHEDAHLKATARRIVWAKFLNAGQTCIAPDYVYVHEKVYDQFLTLVLAEIGKSDYSFDNDNYVEIINDRNFDRIVDMIDPDKVVLGGDHDRGRRWIAPTVLKDVEETDACMADEIFGPIMPLLRYDDLEEVIRRVNDRPKPLSLYLFTEKNKTAEDFIRRVPFGGGCVNDTIMQIVNYNLPFGGVGNSGMGGYHGLKGFETFTHYKSILKKPTWLELPFKFSPLKKWKLWWIRRILD